MEGFPRDVLRLLLFKYLDGPTGCAFLQTCKRINEIVNLYERQDIRLKLRDGEWHARRVLEKAQCCPHCLDILHPNTCPFVSLEQHIKEHHAIKLFEIHCERCKAKGTQRQLLPWAYVREMTLKCASCMIDFSTKRNYWEGREMSCTQCGPLCDFCLKLKFHCDYCKEDVAVRHECPGRVSWAETFKETFTNVVNRMIDLQQQKEKEVVIAGPYISLRSARTRGWLLKK